MTSAAGERASCSMAGCDREGGSTGGRARAHRRSAGAPRGCRRLDAGRCSSSVAGLAASPPGDRDRPRAAQRQRTTRPSDAPAARSPRARASTGSRIVTRPRRPSSAGPRAGSTASPQQTNRVGPVIPGPADAAAVPHPRRPTLPDTRRQLVPAPPRAAAATCRSPERHVPARPRRPQACQRQRGTTLTTSTTRVRGRATQRRGPAGGCTDAPPMPSARSPSPGSCWPPACSRWPRPRSPRAL